MIYLTGFWQLVFAHQGTSKFWPIINIRLAIGKMPVFFACVCDGVIGTNAKKQHVKYFGAASRPVDL